MSLNSFKRSLYVNTELKSPLEIIPTNGLKQGILLVPGINPIIKLDEVDKMSITVKVANTPKSGINIYLPKKAFDELGRAVSVSLVGGKVVINTNEHTRSISQYKHVKETTKYPYILRCPVNMVHDNYFRAIEFDLMKYSVDTYTIDLTKPVGDFQAPIVISDYKKGENRERVSQGPSAPRSKKAIEIESRPIHDAVKLINSLNRDIYRVYLDADTNQIRIRMEMDFA